MKIKKVTLRFMLKLANNRYMQWRHKDAYYCEDKGGYSAARHKSNRLDYEFEWFKVENQAITWLSKRGY